MSPEFRAKLVGGSEALGIEIEESAVERLERYCELLLKWNRKVNLTAAREAGEIAERHLVDSLALLRLLEPGREPSTVLDIGSGAGLPGLALACARPELTVTCCDSVGKKMVFVKAAAAALGLGVRGVAVRAAGSPEEEGLSRAELVVSRAMVDPAGWVPLGARYLERDGRLVAMLGREAEEPKLDALGQAQGLTLERVDRFRLPGSGALRANAVWRAS